MGEKINSLYNKIANNLNETIPEEWDKIYMYAEINEDMQRTFFNYYPKGSNESVYSLDIPEVFEVSEEEQDQLRYQLSDYLTELWQEFKDSEKEVWTNLTFILESTGKFKIDYDYTDLSEASPRKQHIIWDYKYLGIIPQNDKDKKIIEEYLKSQGK
ncbi:MAG TPA: immunity protein YezG family protein [Clostridia bacterium]